jgi:hypothetical protein
MLAIDARCVCIDFLLESFDEFGCFVRRLKLLIFTNV